jgi:hypothetical protein
MKVYFSFLKKLYGKQNQTVTLAKYVAASGTFNSPRKELMVYALSTY